jgi:TolB-like protein
MISGRRAFEAKTPAETLSSILRDSPAELSASGNRVPSEIGHLISHSLEKNPEERFQSARDLAFGLKAALGSSTDSGVSAPTKTLNSIAVLPFANASRDPDSEYLIDGITESIINSLAQLSQLRVTPRSTVFRYKGRDADPQAIGHELKVRVVLTGRVVQRGETLVVGAELIDVAEGSQLWGERYNRKLSDIFELEEEIARKISESLRLKLTGEDQKRLAKRFTEDSEAYQLYLKGRHYWIKRTPDNLKKGAEYFQQAIEKDPGYALAYAGLADCYSILSLYVIIPPRDGWAKAKTAAAAAIALGPNLAEGHASQGLIRTFLDWEWIVAEKEFQRAAELNPAYWVTPYWYSLLLNGQGRHEEAEQQARHAQGLEPLSPVIAFAGAFTSYCARRYAEAIDRCLKGIEIDSTHPLLRMFLGAAYEAQLQYEEAIRELEIATKLLEGSTMCIGWLAHAHASAGEPGGSGRPVANAAGACGEKRGRAILLDPGLFGLARAGAGTKLARKGLRQLSRPNSLLI